MTVVSTREPPDHGPRSAAMDIAAITELKCRAIEALASAEKYRALAESQAALRGFYHALATTYERAAREMNIMLEKVERVSRPDSEAA
jgi:hypothetical protein